MRIYSKLFSPSTICGVLVFLALQLGALGAQAHSYSDRVIHARSHVAMSMEVSGHTPRAQFRRLGALIDAALPGAEKCFRQELRHDALAAGSMALRVRYTRHGKALVSLRGGSVSQRLQGCVQRAVKQAKLKPAPRRASAVVRVNFVNEYAVDRQY